MHERSAKEPRASRDRPVVCRPTARAAAVAGLIALLMPAAAASGATDDDPLAELPAFVEWFMAESDVPGAAVGVIRNGEVIFARGFGNRDRDAVSPVDARTLFHIASISKSFTSATVGLLAGRRQLRSRTPIVDYMPDFAMADEYATRHCTVEDLLAHRSGLSGHEHLTYFTDLSPGDLFDRLAYLEFPPGSEFRGGLRYTNEMYDVVGYIVGRTAGTSWEDFAQTSLLDPLGMKRTFFTSEVLESDPNAAKPYHFDQDTNQRIPFGHFYRRAEVPSGGMISCLDDMLVWLKLNMNGGRHDGEVIVDSRWLHRAQMPHATIFYDPDADEGQTAWWFGLGWSGGIYNGEYYVECAGQFPGYMSRITFFPYLGIGVVVLTNGFYHAMTEQVTWRVLDLIHGWEPQDAVARIAGIKADRSISEGWERFRADADPADKPTIPIDGIVGRYVHPAYGAVRVAQEMGKMRVTVDSGESMPLAHYKGNTFTTTHQFFWLDRLKCTFSGTGARADTLAIPLFDGGRDVVFVRT